MSGINLKKIFAPIDMTVGNPGKQIVAFAVPMLIGNIAQQLYNTADSIVVGHYVGSSGERGAYFEFAPRFIYRYFRRGRYYGFPIFRGKTKGGFIRYNRKLCDVDSYFFCDYYGNRASGVRAFAGVFGYTGNHIGMVQILSEYYFYRNFGDGIL